MQNRIGQQIGSYRILRLLGEGGFAEVYLGEHLHLGTQAAIKILNAQLASDDMEHFRSEARIIAHLEHPHIVRVLDFGIDGKTPYLVMGYAPNGALRHFHRKGVPLPLTTIVPYVRQIADALQYAHEQKVIHRDIKPENMLLGRRNEILLSDFGIAFVTQSSRYQGTRDVVGTVAYMAPEQIQGKPRPASDQYALGVVIYEWLTGERPFHGSFTEIAVQHVVATPPPLRVKLPSIAPGIEQVVLIALAKDPQQRFTSVQAFAHAFEQASQEASRHVFASSPFESHPLASVDQNASAVEPTLAVTPREQISVPPIPEPQVPQPQQGIPRRLILVGIAGLAAVAGGGLTWLALSQKWGAVTATQPTAVTGVPTAKPTLSTSPTPLGTRWYIYRGHSGYIYGVTWASADGQRIASASLDKTVQDWNATSGVRYFTYNHSKSVNDVKSSHDKQFLASASDDMSAQIRDASAGVLLLTYRNHNGAVYTVEWSPLGGKIASASADTTVHIWDPQTGVTFITLQGHTAEVWSAGWSPDGQRIVSASADGTAIVWDATTGAKLLTYTRHTATVRTVSWSPDGQYIASGSEDQTVHIWDAATGATRFIYRGHTERLRTVAWSHHGTRIVSGAKDNTAQIWDALAGTHIYTYYGHTATVFDAQWSSDDTRIASCSTDETVQVWQAS